MNQITAIAPVREPQMLPQLFVGSIDGQVACTADDKIYPILPKLLAIVVLQGAQHFCIDEKHFVLDAGQGESRSPLILLLNISRPAKLQFFNESEVPLRKVQISAPAEWLGYFSQSKTAGFESLKKFRSRHLSHKRLTPSAEMMRLAEQVIAPPTHMQGELYSLYRQNKGLELLISACLTLLEGMQEKSIYIQHLRKADQIKSHILDNIDADISLGEIAQAVGASVSSAQRYFKSAFGQTILDFVRAQRLEKASLALKEDGITIAQAAHLAGYSSPAHFSTAFKRAYGIVPSARRR